MRHQSGFTLALAGFALLTCGDATIKSMAGLWPAPAIAAFGNVCDSFSRACGFACVETADPAGQGLFHCRIINAVFHQPVSIAIGRGDRDRLCQSGYYSVALRLVAARTSAALCMAGNGAGFGRGCIGAAS